MAENRYHNMFGRLGASRIDHRGEILVIGLGRFGSSLARTLVGMGHEVLGVDADAEIVQNHAGVLTHVVQADTTTVRALEQVGAGDAFTAVVCIGTDLEASVLTTAALVDLEIPNIWAKAITEAHGRILERVGEVRDGDKVVRQVNIVFPEAQMGERVAHLVTGAMYEYVALEDDFIIVETKVPAEVVGQSLGDAGLRARYRVTVVCVKPEGGTFTYAERDTVMGEDDLIVVAGQKVDVERFAQRERR